ncbi:hypothetical protein HYH02_012597 [Chlamydomonas schloesseri]|uniref:RNA polymerase sigma-70 region 2 domain-containing protein n=1 Tax=Chlamydomonas schloesseri TaxID=2026947 RepID=A0A835SUK6_9CHLO|nr:hypothetical protein HYH02_012597 [Chlamydomonas schloesseri]|eukprot:KAG2433479.1 hypothetical protein HYH02_012597 [Chlamydomonas schloesseri]
MASKLPGLDVSFAYQRLQQQSTSTSHAPTEATDLQPATARSQAPPGSASDALPTFSASDAAPQIEEMVASDTTATHIVAGLSAELDALLMEVEQELLPFLGTRPQQPSGPEQYQPQQQQKQQLPNAASSTSRSFALPATGATATVAATTSSTRSSRKLPATNGLSLLQLTQRPAGGRHTARRGSKAAVAAAAAAPAGVVDGEADAIETSSTALVALGKDAGAGAMVVAASAGDRAQRRRQIWQKSVEPSPALPKNSYFKAKGDNSVAKFMGGFQRDALLNQAEELQLVSAAQDFLELQEVRRIMASVLRRQPSLEELAEATRCDVDTLRLRLDAGNRARAILAQKNYRLVVACAKWACSTVTSSAGGRKAAGGGSRGGGSGHDGSHELAFEDALTAGMEGLMRGIQKFKPSAGNRLSTYCTWWIRMSIRKALLRQATALQLPISVMQTVETLMAARQRLTQPDASPPSDEALAAELGWSITRVRNADAARRFAASVRSFEAPTAAPGGGSGGGGRDDDGDGPIDAGFGQVLDEEDFAEGAGSALALDSEEHFMRSTDVVAAVEGVLAEIDSALDSEDSALLRSEFGLDEPPPELICGVQDLDVGHAAGGGGSGGSGKRRRRKTAAGAAAPPVGTVSSAQAAAVAAVARGRAKPVAAVAAVDQVEGAPARASGAERLQLAGPERKAPRTRTRVRHALKRLKSALGKKHAEADAEAEMGPAARGSGAADAGHTAAADGQEAERSGTGIDARTALLLAAGRDARLGGSAQGRSSGGYTKKSSF